MVRIHKVDGIFKITIVLHNWLKISSSERYITVSLIDTEDMNIRCIIMNSWRTQDTQVNSLFNLQVT